MKWFKHLAGSLNNSIIFEAIELYGSDAYLVFFGTLEMMSDEFDIHNPGVSTISIKKMTKNFQLSRQKTIKILSFFDQKAKEKPQEKVSFLVEFEKNHVTVTCYRLRDLCDNWTKKLLKELQSDSKETSNPLPPIEEEEEVEESKDQPPLADSYKKILKIKDLPKDHSDTLGLLIIEIRTSGLTGFAERAWEFVGYCLKRGIDFEQLELSFKALLKSNLNNDDHDCWGYCWNICDSQQKEVNYERNQEQLEEIKKEGDGKLLAAVIKGRFNK